MRVKTYPELRSICEKTSRITERLVDNFLTGYAAGHQGLEKKMEQQFARFRHVEKELGREGVNYLKGQYLAHKVFRHEGLIGKFLKHPALNRLTGEERDYLLGQAQTPWRFSFSVIVEEPAEDFFRMRDVFRGEEFLLYSPGVSDLKGSATPVLWLNLVGFNGHCWQSYGPIASYRSFEPGDIYFFATEVNPSVEEPEEVPADVERDPLPYMMLLTGAAYPMTFNKKDQLLYLMAEHDLAILDTAGLKKEFKTEYDSGVYRICHKQWGEPPHQAEAYFDEKEELLLFTAMTERGFGELVKAFNTYGHDFPAEAFLRINLSMLKTAGDILKRKVVLNEYHDLFREDPDPQMARVVDDINAFMARVLPDINAGRDPDIEAAARETGVDPETARDLLNHLMERMDSLPGTPKQAQRPGRSPKSQKSSASKKLPATGLGSAVIRELPPQAGESSGIRLLSADDELLFDLHLYSMAAQIRMMAPWEYMYENELFGVQVPGKEQVYFISVMGSEGEFASLAFYKGFEGVERFWEFREEMEKISDLGLSPESEMPAAVLRGGTLTIPHLLLSYADREELEKEDLAAIKKSGYSFRGKGHWPQIEEIVPGHVPVYPGRERLVELFLVMKQALVVLEKIEKDYRYLRREDDPDRTVPVWLSSGKGPRFRWKLQYLVVDPDWGEEPYEISYLENTLANFSRLPETGQTLQIDLFMLPSPVMEKGTRGYFPFVVLMVDKHTGLVTGTAMLTPIPGLRTMYGTVPQRVLEELMKLGYRPSKIEVRSDLLLELLEEVLEEAGCLVEWEPDMPYMDEVISGMISGMG